MVRLIILFPSILFFIVWFFSGLVSNIFFYSVKVEVILLFISFLLPMFFGDLIGKTFRIKCFSLNLITRKSVFSLVVILLFFSVYYVVKMFFLILSFPSISEALLYIRKSNLEGVSVIEFYGFYIAIIQMLLSISVFGFVFSIKKNDRKLAVFYTFCIFLSALASVLDGSRSFMITGIVWYVVVLILMGKVGVFKLALYLSYMVIFIVLTFSIFRPIDGDLKTSLMYVAVYFSGGISGLNYVFSDIVAFYWQDFESIFNKLNVFGFSSFYYDLSSLNNDFVYISNTYMTNVFTSIGVYYRYMGSFILLFGFFIGLAGGFLSFQSKRSEVGVWLYSLYLCAIILSIFHDYFISFFYLILKASLVLLLYSFVHVLIKKVFRGF